jgi:hypothetical protein
MFFLFTSLLKTPHPFLFFLRASRVFGDEGNLKEDLSTLFCSQLCAAVYKVLGILPNNQRSNNFLPKDFASLNGVPLAKGASLDSKIRTPSKVINVTS